MITLLISSDGHLENRDNPFKVQLPTEIDSNSPVMVSYGDYKLSFCFEGIVSSSADVKQGTSETVLTQELQNQVVRYYGSTNSDKDTE